MSSNKMEYLIAGIDEAGCGPLAGPVIAAAVILHPNFPIVGLADSKKLTAKQREELFTLIYVNALAVSVGRAEVEEIDQINIYQATMLAMQRASAGLTVNPNKVLVDGNRMPKLTYETVTIIKGDETEPVISAASIIAKVTRDREMIELDKQYPQYGFARHKGYGTRDHLAAIAEHGVCQIHRRSYQPIKDSIVRESLIKGVES